MGKGIIGMIFGLIAFFIGFMVFSFSGGVFVFAPIIFFLIVILFITGIFKFITKNAKESRHYSSERHYQGYGNLKECHKCKEMIDVDFDYCPKCGASQKDTIICEYCGHENPASNALCEKCNGFL